jgi:probable F420-dependent oxidoreductase
VPLLSGAVKIDVMLSDSIVGAADRARALEPTGVDGVFSFENSHDLFFPLVAAAPECTLDLMTNVAIAFPRSPTHLAHAAYDLHLYSECRFRLGLGTQVRAHVEKRFGARWDKPVRQMREWVLATKAILTSWQDRTRLEFRGEYTTHTLMTPAFDPGRGATATAIASAPTSPATSRATTSSPSSPPPSTRRPNYTPVLM